MLCGWRCRRAIKQDELKNIDEVIDAVMPYLGEESKSELNRQGRYVYDKEFGWVTPAINSKICVYGIVDKKGIVKCGIEQAYLMERRTGKSL